MNHYKIVAGNVSFEVESDCIEHAVLEASYEAKRRFILSQRAIIILLENDATESDSKEFDLDGVFVPTTWGEIQDVVKEARAEAKAEAQRNFTHKCVQSRGAFVYFERHGNLTVTDEGSETFEMPKTKKGFEKLVSEITKEFPDVTRVYVMVGMDSAASVWDLREMGDYVCWTGESQRLLKVM